MPNSESHRRSPLLWVRGRAGLIPALLAAGARAIVPDMRGFGASDKPRDEAAYASSEPPPSDRTPFTSDGGWREDGQMQRYSPEFRRDAVALVRSSGRSIVAVAQELGINDTTLGNWVRDDRKQTNAAGLPPGPEDAEMEEVRRLRKRIAELEKEREILKRAVAFWVKEESRG